MGRKKFLFIFAMLLASVLVFVGGLVTATGYRNFGMLTDPDAVPGQTRPFWERFLENFNWDTFDFSQFDWESFGDDFPWDKLPWDSIPDDFDLSKIPWDKLNDTFPWQDLHLNNLPDDFDWEKFLQNVPDDFDWANFLGDVPPDFDWGNFLNNVPEDFNWGNFFENLPEDFDWSSFLASVPDDFDWENFLSSTPPDFDWVEFIQSMPPDFDWSKIPWQSFGEDFAWDQMPWEYLIPLAVVGAIVMPWDKISPEDVPSDILEQFGFYPSEWFHIHTFDEGTNMCTICHRPRLYVLGATDEFVYNGAPQSSTTFTIVEEKCGLLPALLGHTVEVTYDVSLTYVKNDNAAGSDGSFYNTFSVTVRDSAGQDVTGNYAIERGLGTIKILPRRITIVTGSETKVYDGDPLECAVWSYAEGSMQLVEGDTFTAYRLEAWPTEVGEYDNIIESYDIKNSAGQDVTGNYEVIPIWGKLTITWD